LLQHKALNTHIDKIAVKGFKIVSSGKQATGEAYRRFVYLSIRRSAITHRTANKGHRKAKAQHGNGFTSAQYKDYSLMYDI
jgi:hypothetical protein